MRVPDHGHRHLHVERHGPVLALWLDRPQKRNALDRDLVSALIEAMEAPRARAVVLGTTDSRAFSAGVDLALDAGERQEVSDLLYELYGRMVTSPVPIVAVIEGHAVGGGAQLAVASDMRVGGASATFRFAGPAMDWPSARGRCRPSWAEAQRSTSA